MNNLLHKYILNLTILIYNIDKKYNNMSELETIKLNDYRHNIQEELSDVSGDINYFTKLNNGLECAIIINHDLKSIITVFRGSDSIKDWIYNLCVFKKQLKDKAYVHYGFYKQLNPIKDTLLKKL